MRLEDLIKKLKDKPQQKEEVQFCIWTTDGDIVCTDMSGPMTQDLVKGFAKHAPKREREKGPYKLPPF